METQSPQNIPPKKGSRTKKILVVGAVAVIVLAGGFYAWRYFTGRRREEEEYLKNEMLTAASAISTAVNTPAYSAPKPVRNDNFPLKKGSKGEKVRQLQNALMAKYGKSALPKYGADGDFGPELETALTKNGWPAVVEETTFNVLVGSTKVQPSTLAKKLYEAAKAKSFDAAIAALKQIDSTQGYKDVSEEFKKLKLNGVQTTLVTGMLHTFTTPSQKDLIGQQFIRMGLSNDGDKWTVSGFQGNRLIITLHDTHVWEYPNKRIAVEGNTILGAAMETRGGYTLFTTLDGRHQLLVKSTSIRNYEEH